MSESVWELTGSTNPGTAASIGPAADRANVYFVVDGYIAGEYLMESMIWGHTGGDAIRLIASFCDRSGATVPLKTSAVSTEVPTPISREPREALSLIQSALGLSITAVAAVLRVERPTIYSWLRSTATPNASNGQRIDSIVKLAEYWLSLSDGARLEGLRDEVLDGKSLFDLLKEEYLRTFTAESVMRELHRRSSDRLRRRSLRDIARDLEISSPDSTEFDVSTGRRIADEDVGDP